MSDATIGSGTGFTCRGCGSYETERVLDLGEIPASDLFPLLGDPAEPPAADPAWPLELYLCRSCLLAQLGPQQHVDPEPPRAVESATALEHAARSAAEIVAVEGLAAGRTVIEIDSHHGGSWLGGFTAAGLVTVPPGGTADLVADVHGLAHEVELGEPMAAHAGRLAPGGRLVIEFHHLLSLIEQTQVDTIRHGHFAYLSLLAMQRLLAQHGLVATRAVRVPVFGGSLRITARRRSEDPAVDESVAEVARAELAAGLGDPASYREFGRRARSVATAFADHLRQVAAAGTTVAGYGAPSKAPVLVALAGVDERLLPYTADLAPAKQGRRLPGTAIAIVAPEELLARRPDEVVVLTWDIADEVVGQLRTAGGAARWHPRFWVPLPRARYLD